MALISWSDDFSVGIIEIDEQHKKLINIINDLHAATLKGKGKDAVGPILSGLSSYVAEHFACEEKYFDRFDYAGSASHKLEHKEFIDRLTQFQKDAERGKVMLSLDIMSFLEEWIKEHIRVSDKGYSGCFKENGLS